MRSRMLEPKLTALATQSGTMAPRSSARMLIMLIGWWSASPSVLDSAGFVPGTVKMKSFNVAERAEIKPGRQVQVGRRGWREDKIGGAVIAVLCTGGAAGIAIAGVEAMGVVATLTATAITAGGIGGLGARIDKEEKAREEESKQKARAEKDEEAREEESKQKAQDPGAKPTE